MGLKVAKKSFAASDSETASASSYTELLRLHTSLNSSTRSDRLWFAFVFDALCSASTSLRNSRGVALAFALKALSID